MCPDILVSEKEVGTKVRETERVAKTFSLWINDQAFSLWIILILD